MKKLSLLFYTAFISGNNHRVKAPKIFFLAFLFCCISNSGFAQVSVTPASGGTLICNGPTAPTVCTTLGDIVIDETNNADFANGTDVLTIVPPTGWAFCVGTCPTFSLTAGGDITAVAGGGCFADHMTVNITSTGTSLPDHIRIVGLQVQPLAGGGATGSINASGVSGINGISVGAPATDFGDLSLNPGIIITADPNGFSICAGGTITLSDPGSVGVGVWTSSSPTDLTIDPSTGVANSPNVNNPTATPTVTFTIGGCSASVVITVNANPAPIVGIHDICQNVCYPISDATVGGNSNFFHSTLVAVTNTGTFGASGTATLCGVNAGVATVTYTTGTGCISTATLNVDPLPSAIIDPSGTYKICAGDAEFLSDASTGGVWTSTNSALATITPNTGDLSAVSAGRDTIIYTLSFVNNVTCAIDTPITINPIPSVITGANNVCVFSTTQLSDATAGGSWSSSNNTFASVTNTGVVTGASAGVVTISYILNTGCFVIYSMTVNPVPDPISGPVTVCATYPIQLNETSTGGTWSSSNSSVATVGPASGIVTGVSGSIQAGADSIFYTFATGCNAIYPITVDSLPDSIRGPQSVCQGQFVILTDATLGGNWTSQLSSFLLVQNVSPGVGKATGIQVGVINVTYTLSTGCYITQAETINPLSPIVGPSKVCEGLSITLNDAAQPGTWSSSNSAVATIDSMAGVLTGISSTAGTPPGIAIISFTNSSGCTQVDTITVNPSPAVITGPDSVCVGSTITLSDSTNFTGGVWISNNNSVATVNGSSINTSGTVGGVSAGTDIITYQLPAGCFNTFSVRVDPLPGPILGPLSVCQGSSVTLSDASGGGTWTSSNSSISPIDTFSGTVISNNFGTDTITYILPTGCKTDTAFTVNPLDSITGPAVPVVCTGSTITLSNNTSGGPGVWTSSNTGIATIDPSTGVLTGTQPGPNSGVVTITYTLPTSCSITYTVLVNPLPDSITGPSAVCQGQFITLSDDIQPGVWSNSNTAIDSINALTGVMGGVSPGVDRITYTLSNTGCLVTTTITVNALTPILPSFTHDVCVGLSITLSDATATGVWSSSNTNIATVGSAVSNVTAVTGASAGVDTISYTVVPTGCTITTTVLVNPLPDSITGMMPVCVNSFIILSDATDSNNVGIWSVGNPSVATITDTLLTGASAGIANVTYQIAATGCIATTTVLVNPLPRPIVGPINVCIHDTAIYSDPDTLGVWSTNPTSVATIATVTDSIGHLHAVDTGTVVVTYTLPTTCEITKTVTIRPLPVVSITQSDSGIICKGATDVLTAVGAGPGGTYVWSPGSTLSCTLCPVTSASPTITTTYVVLETTQYGCKDTSSTTVHVDTALNHLAISGRDSICAGGYDTLMITGGVDSIYFWKPPTGLNCTNCQITIASPENTTTYWAIAVDFLGCKDSTSFTVTVNPIPVLVIDPNPTIICKHTALPVTVSGAGPNAHYTWSPNVFISCDTCADVILTDTANITYEVVGTSQYGCTDSISVKVSVLDTNVNTISDDTLICIGKSAQLLATSHGLTSNTSDPSYVWSPASSLNNPYIFNPTATPNVTTVYTVVITENVCFSKTEYVQVTVEPLPAINITVSPSTTVIAGTAVQLIASAPNVVVDSFAWTPGNTLSCDTCYNPIATPYQNSTTYTVTAISNFGCIASDTVTIHLFCDNSQIFIPNSFSPNGDGVNDRFFPSGKGVTMINDFAVYNRWGQLLFEAHNFNVNDPGAGWDGTFKGHVLEPDVFIYKLTGTCELGEPFSYTGDVSILR